MEGAVHATRRFVEDMQKDTVPVKLDVSNAFNTLRRDLMLEAVARYIPELYAFAYANYILAAQLKFNEASINYHAAKMQADRSDIIPSMILSGGLCVEPASRR